MADAPPELVRAVLALPPTSYAVVDGAHFEDALLSLSAMEIPARSLFINRSPSAVRAGPFLAQLRTKKSREALFGFIGDKPAAVFWTCSQGESILFRHLRTINMALIPGEEGADDTVLFRHYDPLVLTLMMPLLDREQFARIIGPAEHIVMFSPDTGVRHVQRPDDLAEARAGLLRVSAAQITGIEDGMRKRSRARIANYLRDAAPEVTATMSDDALLKFVGDSEDVGRVLGLRTEQGFGRWAYLMLMTNGEVAQSREVRVFIADNEQLPDDQVTKILRFSAMVLKRQAAEAAP